MKTSKEMKTEINATTDSRLECQTEIIRFTVAKWIFWGGLVVNFLSWMLYVFAPDLIISECVDQYDAANQIIGLSCQLRYDRLVEVSEKIFSFATVWIPPLLGLVIGYYFSTKETKK